ncbi:TerB family tellurite resistance protein [Allostreptomyces psammosilenae]|uniref:Co-chaperone DjlA N-terminal domain-containing protein n=1 Tax=Allostreptomyces psammosilenae TaxID=1892865 RepID=A0A852ZWA9_9ACTN|nr:TerB family tellurite resistance protein [Allostreptomyces psammosilenae]NYI06683.1 hypothetical protein [Allostreptomyces psammosilenae]
MPLIGDVRTGGRTVASGDFYCPSCGGDRRYRKRIGRRWHGIGGLPLLPSPGRLAVVECVTCHTAHQPEVLERPTTAALAGMLREGARTAVTAVLTAGGPPGAASRERAAAALRQYGWATPHFPRASGEAPASGAPADPLRDALEPVARHLAPQGRERLLRLAAGVALADGPYAPAERAVLAAVGHRLGLTAPDVERITAEVARASDGPPGDTRRGGGAGHGG